MSELTHGETEKREEVAQGHIAIQARLAPEPYLLIHGLLIFLRCPTLEERDD